MYASSRPNFIELLKQKILPENFVLSRNELDISHKLHTRDMDSLAGNNMLLRLAACSTYQSSSVKLGPVLYSLLVIC